MADEPKPEDFFLQGSEPDDRYAYGTTPPRAGIKVTPLIDAEAAFSAMEAAIAAATSSVLLSFWILDPNTPVQNRAVRVGGAPTWGDLLRQAAARGVTVRILLTDFDPLLQKTLHTFTWRMHEALLGHAVRLGADRGKLEVLVSMHPAIVQVGVQKQLASALDALVAKANKAGVADTLRHHPGVWAWLDYNPKLKTVSVKKDAQLVAHVASHHQKQCIVDETLAFCGGLDVADGRLDNPNHNRRAWHDVHVQVDAQAAIDIHHNFVTRWNEEAPAYLAFVTDANNTGMPVTLPVHSATVPLAHSKAKPKLTGSSVVQIQRTLSRDSKFSAMPKTVVKDIMQAYEKAIGQASRYIYIENQYVRAPVLGDWIVERALAVPELVVIVVLPVAPEEVAGTIDEVTNQGLLRQRELLERMAKALGPRFGMFSMIQRSQAIDPRHTTNLFGSTQVYVHSKMMLVDDAWATIGSANANPRSFLVDTELNASFHDPAVVAKLRLMLWAEMLGSPPGLAAWKPADFVAEWAKIAKANTKAAPEKRSGFIVPHDPKKFPGVATPGLPDELVDVIDGPGAPPDMLPA